MVVWGEHTSAVYNTRIFVARLDDRGASAPARLDPSEEIQSFPFIAGPPDRLAVVYQVGDYNGAPKIVVRFLD